MFANKDAEKKKEFLEKAQQARKARAEEKVKEKSVVIIQVGLS